MDKKRKIEIMSCTGCGFCKEGCPVFEETGIESSSGKGKILLAYGLLQGDILENESINRALYECSLCKKCETRCPSLIDIPLIISSMRKQIKDLPQHQQLIKNIQTFNNPFGETYVSSGLNKNSTLGYFPGCFLNVHEKNIKKATLSVLKKLGYVPHVVNTFCCNAPLERIGAPYKSPKREYGQIKTLLFSCPACLYMFKKNTPKNIHLSHITEFILQKKPRLTSWKKKVIYHDPCYLGRWLGIYDAPRHVLQNIPGLELVEFADTRESASCCGSEVEFRTAFPQLADKMGKQILKEAKEKNALVATASPHCSYHLKKLGGHPLDILEIVDKCLSVH
jgi:Fe-S oxidoreductase